jgi:hypothetical protein
VMPQDTRTSLRLPADLLKRVRHVREVLNKTGRGFTYRDSEVIRAALVRGLDALEEEAAGQRSRRG